ncbi:MAG: metal ABC transporter substrate-binding protein [bacterium]|nr:metal ABC transporter substrate-binding protein [Candidatus Sumerlaeota bacterium]
MAGYEGAGFRAAVAVIAIMALGCGATHAGDEQAPDRKIRVAATIFPLQCWVKKIGGGYVEAVTLLPAGVDPHTFDPAPSDMRKTAGARLFLKIGLGLDDWADRLAAAGGGKMIVLALGNELKSRGQLPDLGKARPPAIGATASGEKDGHGHNGIDPHFWLDPLLAAIAADDIANALTQADPAHADEYAANAKAWKCELQALTAQIKSQLDDCTSRSFVTFHNAFAYFAARFDLTVAGVIVESPGKTPSDRYLKDLVRLLREQHIGVVFAEPQFDRRAAAILAAETGGRVDTLDDLGAAGAPGRGNYTELLMFNAAKLREALGCK